MKQLSLLSVLFFLLSSCFKGKEADLIIHNARIYSLDKNSTVYQAMAIKDGKIIELGPEREIMNKYAADREIDAMGKMVIPGFHDSHCHVLGFVEDSFFADLRWLRSKKKTLEVARTQQPLNNWIIGRGWDESLWENKERPTLKELDSLFPDQPLLLTRIDGHGALINSKTFELFDSLDRQEILPGQVEYVNGEFTGFIMDNALDLVYRKSPMVSKEQLKAKFEEFQQTLFEYGITSINEAGLTPTQIEWYKQLEEEGILKLDVYAMIFGNEEGLQYALKNGKYKSELLNVSSFKLIADGSLGSRGACMLAHYSDQPTYGQIVLDSSFKKVLSFAYLNEFQVNTHCIGDSANRFVLEAYGDVLKEVNDCRWKIEHAQVMNTSDFELFSKFSVIPSVQPNHAMDDMRWAEDRIGGHRLEEGAYNYKKLFNTSGMLAIGTDFPVTDINPFYNFFCSVFRQNKELEPKEGFLAKNGLSRIVTLRGMTQWGAVSNFEEGWKGTLEEGKNADLIILSADLLEAPKDQILKAYVEYTIKKGKVVYE
ncbi:MAG: amidohydrolase [Crocinitomicaceae bacterium]